MRKFYQSLANLVTRIMAIANYVIYDVYLWGNMKFISPDNIRWYLKKKNFEEILPVLTRVNDTEKAPKFLYYVDNYLNWIKQHD